MTDIYFRHDKVRRHQQELLNDSYAAVSEGQILLAHAPTGLGKTDAALGAALTHALQENLTVFFLTPKISQHRIALDVVRGIEAKYKLGLRAVDMIGRRYACIDDTLRDLDHEGFYYSCQKKRREEQCAFYGNARGYNPAGESKAGLRFQNMLAQYGSARTHEEVIGMGERQAACPYEWMIQLAGVAHVVVADYFHLMVPSIRQIFLKKIKKQLDRSIVVVDEAHNLGKRVREQLSSTVNFFVFRRAEREMRLLGAEVLPLEKTFQEWCDAQLKTQREMQVSKESLVAFLHAMNLDQKVVAYFEQLGAAFIERTHRKSACLKIAQFLAQWEEESPGIVRILQRRPLGCSLSKRFLDPAPATGMLNQCYASILMSGTLLPLDMHRDLLGIDPPRAVLKRYASPFEQRNRMNIIAENATTRYSQRTFENYRQMALTIDRVVAASPSGVAVFFPSYKVLGSVVPLLASPSLLVQKERMHSRDVAELLRRFSQGGTLCAVQGGSLAEGVDYCNGEIKTVLVVGVALDEMSLEVKALIDHYDEKFQRGWDYGYLYPAMIKALQAAGRGIRKENDRAAIVFLDERFNWKNYRSLLGNETFIVTNEPEKYVQQFWAGTEGDAVGKELVQEYSRRERLPPKDPKEDAIAHATHPKIRA